MRLKCLFNNHNEEIIDIKLPYEAFKYVICKDCKKVMSYSSKLDIYLGWRHDIDHYPEEIQAYVKNYNKKDN